MCSLHGHGKFAALDNELVMPVPPLQFPPEGERDKVSLREFHVKVEVSHECIRN